MDLGESEVIGLKWSAVDFENKTITINHIITQLNGKLVIRDRTKTKSSKRTLPLEPIVESYLKEKIKDYPFPRFKTHLCKYSFKE